jgi:hypothetical protein
MPVPTAGELISATPSSAKGTQSQTRESNLLNCWVHPRYWPGIARDERCFRVVHNPMLRCLYTTDPLCTAARDPLGTLADCSPLEPSGILGALNRLPGEPGTNRSQA